MRDGHRRSDVIFNRHTPQHMVFAASAPAWWRRHIALLAALDAAAVTIAVATSRFVSFGFDAAELEVRGIHIPYLALAIAVVPTWLAILAISGCYDVGPFGTATGLTRRIVRSGANLLAVVAVAYYLLHLEKLARGFLATMVPLAVALTLALRPLARAHLRALRARGRGLRRAVITGAERSVSEVVAHSLATPSAGLLPVAACIPEDTAAIATPLGEVPTVGHPDRVLDALRDTNADMLVITSGLPPGRVRSLAWELEGSGIDVLVAPTTTAGVQLDVRPVDGLPLVYLDDTPEPATPPASEAV